MAEIDDDKLLLLQRSHDVLMKLNGDPNTRPLLERGIKHHFPDVVTEEEAAARMVAPQIEKFQTEVVAPLADELKALRESREQQRAQQTEAELNSAFSEIRRSRGFTDEGIEAVKKLMVDRSIADPHAAAALFAEQNQPAPQDAPGWTPSHWNIDQTVTDFDLKGLFENEDAWGDRMAAKALNEIRVGQAA